MTTNTTETLTVRLPSKLLGMLDQLVERKLFSSRSEAIREFCREYVLEHQNTHQNTHKNTDVTDVLSAHQNGRRRNSGGRR